MEDNQVNFTIHFHFVQQCLERSFQLYIPVVQTILLCNAQALYLPNNCIKTAVHGLKCVPGT